MTQILTSRAALAYCKDIMSTSTTVELKMLSKLHDQAIFICENDTGYFVIEAEGAYHTIVCAISVEGEERRPVEFEVCAIYTHSNRDTAILRALHQLTNDAGHEDSSLAWCVEQSRLVTTWC